MAVTVDAKCAAVTEISAVNGTTGKTSTNLTVTASATALLVSLCFDGSVNLSSIAVHWDSTGTNVALTQIGTTVFVSTVGQIALFGLINPVAGAKTLKATWSGTGTGYMASMSFAGTSTTSVATAFTGFLSATPTGSTGSFNCTGGATGNFAFAVNGNDTVTYTTFLTTTGGTALYTDANENYSGAAYVAEAGATTTFTWAQGSSNQNVVAGLTIAAPAGTNASPTGVAGTGQVGTVIASIGKSPTGVAGTGSAGTAIANPGKTPTGVTGTGAAGMLVSSLGGSLAGAAGTGSAGTTVAQDSKGPTGVAGTGGAGSLSGQTGGSMGSVGGTGQAGIGQASIGAYITGAAGTGAAGILQGVQGTNAIISGVSGTGQVASLAEQVGGGMSGAGGTGAAQGLADEVDIAISGVEGDMAVGILTTTSVIPAPPIQGGPGDDEHEAAESRRKWLEWSRKKRQKEKAKLAPVVAKATEPEPIPPLSPSASLLERNLHAQRMQIIKRLVDDAAAFEAARLQDEDDEEAIALLMDV